jgi:hypothetical protein
VLLVHQSLDEIAEHDAECSIDQQLCDAAYHARLPDIMSAVARGADVNFINAADGNKTPLIKAVESVSFVGRFFVAL